MKQNGSLTQDEETSIRTFDYHYIPMEYMRDDILSRWLLFEFNTSFSDDIAIKSYTAYLNGVVKHHNMTNKWDDIRVYLLFPQAKATWTHIEQRIKQMDRDEAIQWQFTQLMKRYASNSEEKEDSIRELDHNYIPMEFLGAFLGEFLDQFSDRLKTCLQRKKIDDKSYIKRIREMDLYLCDVVRHHNIDGEFPFYQYQWR
eukprot:850079_1